jgi:dynactin complex subunit
MIPQKSVTLLEVTSVFGANYFRCHFITIESSHTRPLLYLVEWTASIGSLPETTLVFQARPHEVTANSKYEQLQEVSIFSDRLCRIPIKLSQIIEQALRN